MNEVLGRRGKVLADRYHARALSSPREVRNAILYVIQNHLHHQPSAYLVDECSSARWFSRWEQPLPPPRTPSPVRRPATWLARTAWRRYGPIRFSERPAWQLGPIRRIELALAQRAGLFFAALRR